MIATILAASRLAVAITTAWPVHAERAAPAALAIVEATRGTPWSPELVAAIAYHETALRTELIGSRGECGMGQVAHRRDRTRLCREARGHTASGRQMVAALEEARRLCRGRVICALNVYAAGTKGMRWAGPGVAVREFHELERQLRAPRRRERTGA